MNCKTLTLGVFTVFTIGVVVWGLIPSGELPATATNEEPAAPEEVIEERFWVEDRR